MIGYGYCGRRLAGKIDWVFLDGRLARCAGPAPVSRRWRRGWWRFGVNDDGYREILGICEGATEDKKG